MKKILFILISIICLCSCTTQTYTDPDTNKWTALQANGIKISHNPQGLNDDYSVIEITYKGNIHEFITYHSGYSGGIAHWPSCKYCNQKSAN